MAGVSAINRISVHPSLTGYKNATVLYYTKDCKHCQNLFQDYAKLSLGGGGVVLAVDAAKHRRTLKQSGVKMTAVPHVVAYSQSGHGYVVPPTEVVGGGLTSRAQLQTMSVSPEDITHGTLVLYYYHACPYCKAFAPEYVQVRSKAKVVAVNIRDHPQALSHLNPTARSSTVPHVVYHGRNGRQYPYDGPRTASAVALFSDHMYEQDGETPQALCGGANADEVDVFTVDPASIHQDTVVLYFYHKCPHCQNFAPVYAQLPHKLQQLGIPTRVVAVDTAAHPGAMSHLNPEAQARGVPHVVYFSTASDQHPFSGPRTLDALVDFIRLYRANSASGGTVTHIQPMVAAVEESDAPCAALDELEVDPSQIEGPAVVLYFYHECPYCEAFAPDFAALPAALPQSSDVSVFTVNIKKHKGILEALDEPARGVPHVVYYDTNNQQIPYKGTRTTQELLRFVQDQQSQTLKGGGDGETGVVNESGELEDEEDMSRHVRFANEPVAPMDRENLEQARQQLKIKASEALGEDARNLFEPGSAGVCFIGLACSPRCPQRDRLYIALIPQEDLLGGGYPVFGVMYGKPNGKLTTAVYTDKDPHTLLERKRNAGYQRVRTTHPLAEKLRGMGYATRVQDGLQSRVLDVQKK